MIINVAKSAGFCFGVKRAINIAYKEAEKEKNIYMLGDIVHNEDVVKEINLLGIKKIKKLKDGKNKTLLIRAHGASSAIFKQARRLGYKIIDATCPMVKEIHRIAKDSELKSYKLIIVGDDKHDEVIGIMGQLKKKAIVIENIENIPLKKIKRLKKAAIVVQSTQNVEKTLAIVSFLKRYINNLKFFNTICKPTRIKQREIKIMPLENNIMIIIGSKTSANTKRLYEISKSLNRRTYWIQSKKDIKLSWFKNVKSVGITAGASTPEYTTKEIIKHINNQT